MTQAFQAAFQELVAIAPGPAAGPRAFAAFRRLALEAGFPLYMLLDLPLALQLGFTAKDATDNWPASFKAHYFERRLYLSDPALIASYREPGPFFWTDAVLKHARTPEQRAVAADLAAEGVREGIVLPFTRTVAWRSLVWLSRPDRLRPDGQTVTLLHLAARHLGDCLSPSSHGVAGEELSARESEILRWVAMGKTALETALILELAKTTVDRHLGNARRKLGARTNAHAVALAMGRILPAQS
jgi:LuxR family quorum sensing-dependent transcriptional regulator